MEQVAGGASGNQNLGRATVRVHRWGEVTVQEIHQEALPGPCWNRISADSPVLSIVLNEVGGHCEARTKLEGRPAAPSRQVLCNGHANFIPAGMETWGFSERISRVDEIRLTLSNGLLATEGIRLDQPRLMFFDEPLRVLAGLLTDDPDMVTCSALFGECVVLTMLARIMTPTVSQGGPGTSAALSARQLAQLSDFVHDNIAAPVSLSQLAGQVGLSVSQFARSFKAATRITPHQWHLGLRINHAKALLQNADCPLVDIALAAGFSEQSQLCRVFKRMTGLSPGEWRRCHDR